MYLFKAGGIHQRKFVKCMVSSYLLSVLSYAVFLYFCLYIYWLYEAR